jgi:hypothetical protein
MKRNYHGFSDQNLLSAKNRNIQCENKDKKIISQKNTASQSQILKIKFLK